MPLWKTDESHLRYYNITYFHSWSQTLCLHFGLTHNVSLCLPRIFFLFCGCTNFVSLSVSSHFALTRTLLLSCHACSSLFIASSPKSGRMELSGNPLFRIFFFSSRSYVHARFSWPNALCRRQRNTWNSHAALGRVKIRHIRRTIVRVTRPKIVKYFAELCVGNSRDFLQFSGNGKLLFKSKCSYRYLLYSSKKVTSYVSVSLRHYLKWSWSKNEL